MLCGFGSVWKSEQTAEPSRGQPGLSIFFTPYALIDLLAGLPFYLIFFVAVDLRFLRLFRLFRILKLTRYSPALQTFAAVIRNERRSIVAAFLVMLIMLVTASSLIFLAEHKVQPEKFASIPDAMLWAIATRTTVGYGDVTPITPLGKVLGGVVMLTGIAMFVLWTGIFASSFAAELRKRDFVVNWNMVAQVPAFASLDATAIVEIARLLDAVVVPERYTIVKLRSAGTSLLLAKSK
jgi:voltage-gated potassium channel